VPTNVSVPTNVRFRGNMEHEAEVNECPSLTQKRHARRGIAQE
jgi:hypothetical protein